MRAFAAENPYGETPGVGDVVFLAGVLRQGQEERLEARLDPWRTNVSHEVMVEGWLGETNNTSRWARGAAIITSESSGKVRVRPLKEDDPRVVEALEEDERNRRSSSWRRPLAVRA